MVLSVSNPDAREVLQNVPGNAHKGLIIGVIASPERKINSCTDNTAGFRVLINIFTLFTTSI